jgi:hypothetical protein
MKRTLILGAASALCLLGLVSASDAQVFIRAPFVRVGVGPFGGVAVRAPFVNLFVPGDPVYGPYYSQPMYGPYYSQPIIVGSTPSQPAQPAQPSQSAPPLAQPPQPVPLPPINNSAPPAPIQANQASTLESFAKTFQPKAGSYEVSLLNPLTNQPTNVRFALPGGTPRRVVTTRDSVEFIYGLRQWVRIEFDKDGAIVTSR